MSPVRSRPASSHAQTIAKSAQIATAETVQRVDELLQSVYRSGDLGNVTRVLDETVFILLSKQARATAYRAVYAQLRKQYPSWREVLQATKSELAEVIRPVGLHEQRAEHLLALLHKVARDNEARAGSRGRAAGLDLTLDYLRGYSDADAEEYLCSLPGVGPKSARCVMAYALGRETLAVDTHVARIFSRLGLVRRQAKPRHSDYDALVPAGIRNRLHINLIHHGRAVCKETKPRCGECVLVSFCKSPAMMRDRFRAEPIRPVAVDLFGGAGGLGAGLRDAGFRVAAAVELDRHAAQTYRRNHPGTVVLEMDASRLTGNRLRRQVPLLGRVDIVVAGPPCQGYSIAGSHNPEKLQNQLFKHVTRLSRELRPKLLLFENVPGIRYVAGVKFARRIALSLSTVFAVELHEVSAADFGVPQLRRRLFFIGRRGRAWPPVGAPVATHARPVGTATKSPAMGVVKLLRGLPAAHVGTDEIIREGKVIANVSTMRHSPRVVRKIARIRPSEGPISYRRLHPDYARTVIAGHRALPVHPTLHRTISVREAARLQGFRDDYVFLGPRASQPLQVANAVPPPVGRAFGKHFIRFLKMASRTRSGRVDHPGT